MSAFAANADYGGHPLRPPFGRFPGESAGAFLRFAQKA